MNASNQQAASSGRIRRTLVAAAVFAVLGAGIAASVRASNEPHVVPPFASADATMAPPMPATATSEVAVLAGGCFWGVQGVFQHVKGVTNAVSGYAGGEERTAQYETVSSGTTGHAESVKITFDPRQVSFASLLQIYFSVVADPTQVNRQGPDFGTQYRSAIFPMNDQQAKIALAYIEQLSKAHTFNAAIATKIEAGRAFYPAEGYHQDYLTLHPNQPYIAINDLPKVADLKKFFPDLYRGEPVLVAKASTK